MLRPFLAMAVLALIPTVGWTQAVPQPPMRPKYNSNDPQSIIDYILGEVRDLLRDPDPLSSLLRQKELERLLAGLPAGAAELQDAVAKVSQQVQLSREKVYVQTTTIEALLQRLRENPDDAYAVHCVRGRLSYEIDPRLFITEPDEAERRLNAVKAVLAEVEPAAKSELTKKHLELARRSVASFDRDIGLSFDVRQKQQAQIGKDAPPLKVETWVTGTKLSPDDLKGKVLLLDFFRSGSTDDQFVANLRQLSQWQEKYAQRGLIVIGLTRYHNFRWDDVAQKPIRVDRKREIVPPAEEQTLVMLLAQQHGLKYRLAIQDRENYLQTFQHYPAMSDPHLVVIDRQGKIRLIRGGASEQFTRDIGQTLETLLGDNVHDVK